MKIIFLDVDGVLNCNTTKNRITANNGVKYDGIDHDKMNMIKKIIDDTDAYIVISSTWRLYDEFMSYLKHKLGDYKNRIVGMTDTSNTYHNRYEQILQYLCDHNKEIDDYIILDDETEQMKETFKEHYFRTSFAIGLTTEISDKCIKYLLGNKNE